MDASLYGYLNTQTSITSLVGDRIYPIHLPDSPVYPAITYTFVSIPHDRNLSGLAGIARYRIQFDCWSYLLNQSQQIGQALLDLFDGYEGTMGAKTILWAKIDNEFDFAESPTGARSQWLYRRTQDYLFRVRE